MSNNIELLKQLVEQKKNKSSIKENKRPDKSMGSTRKGVKQQIKGGFFDK